MKPVLVAIALLFAMLPSPAGAQSKAKSKSSTKATEESPRKNGKSADNKSATAKKAPAASSTSRKLEAVDAGGKESAGAGSRKSASSAPAKKGGASATKGGQSGAASNANGAATSGAKAEMKGMRSAEDAAEQAAAQKSPPSKTTSTTAKKSGRPEAKPIDKPPQDNAGEEPTRKSPVIGPNITLDPDDLADFERNSRPVQRLLELGLELTRQGLTYRYGSSDPSSGGMDCSGTIYFLLKAAGVKEPPRDSSGMYLWAQKEGTLRRVSPTSLDDSAFAELRPGDLLFWEGTYEVQRDPPISHTMIYLGKEKATGIPVMVGASDGRTYGGVRRNGVSVFDFKLPRADSAAKFVAYARVPGIEDLANGKRK